MGATGYFRPADTESYFIILVLHTDANVPRGLSKQNQG